MSTNKNKWFEISLFDHWGDQPHGIARVTQNLFLSSLESEEDRYFYYCMRSDKYVVPRSVEYFKKLATGGASFSFDGMPEADDFQAAVSDGDRILITGAGWGLKHYLSLLREIKSEKQVKIACIIYDIIAVHSPQFFLEEFAGLVANYQREIVDLVDHVACISNHTELDVKAHLIKDAAKTTSVFTMGADFPAYRSEVSVADDIEVPAGKFILTVGTIEARKNHLLLYYVLRKLILLHGDDAPDLVVVGKVGWLSSNVLELMRRDPVVNRKVHILNGVADSVLEKLYQSCLFTVYPSFYEGYGLPILESLGRGKVCLCSNTSSMKEITPFADLTFDPYDSEQAFTVVNQVFAGEGVLAGREESLSKLNFTHSWKDSYAELATWFDAS
jgi:glycosyltransferase involved in cell wall biosynthesis